MVFDSHVVRQRGYSRALLFGALPGLEITEVSWRVAAAIRPDARFMDRREGLDSGFTLTRRASRRFCESAGDLTSFAIPIGSWLRIGFETQRGPCGDRTHPDHRHQHLHFHLSD
jgi:hypothetical protein